MFPLVFSMLQIKKKGFKTEKQTTKTTFVKPITKQHSKTPKISHKNYPKTISSVNIFSPPKLLQEPDTNGKSLHCNKENLPSTFGKTIAVYLSPKNSGFYSTNEQENRRETYVFDKKIQNSRLMEVSTPERRETYILHEKPLEGHPSLSRDSTTISTPIVSPTNPKNNKVTCSMRVLSDQNSLSFHHHPNTRDVLINSSQTPPISDFEYKMMRLQSFCFSPLDTSNTKSNSLVREVDKQMFNRLSIIPSIDENNTFALNSRRAIDAVNVSSETCIKHNISGETYDKNNSFETYVKMNLSNVTYTKDEVHSCKISPTTLNTSLSPRLGNGKLQETFEYKRELQQKSLSCIVEEDTFMLDSCHQNTPNFKIVKKPLFKRKSDFDYMFSPPKKANVTNSIKDWSRRGGNTIRIAKHSTGLNVTHLKKKMNTELCNETIVEFAKTDTNHIIIQNPFLLAATNSVDPFIARHLAVSEEWIEKQENNFKNWLNTLLTPPKDLASDEQTVSVAKIWQQCKNKEIDIAPSKEIICNNYHTSNRLNYLRKSASEFYQTKEFCQVLSNVYNAVDQGKLSIREDKDIRSNIALRAEITSNLLNYNPLWLRIGLETIYNDIIPLTSNSDFIGLSHFIGSRMLRDPYLLKKHKSLHTLNYVKDFNKFFLKKYFSLIYFLDKAKNAKLISHDPCLFCKKGTVKESKELLLRLARETLSAVGDITKYLKYLGYIVTHVQTYIHEFDYGVKNLGVDLRDGVRLTKIMEIILMNKKLTCGLRVPAISRLQKVHNMKIVFDGLKKAGYTIMYDISPKDIVDGHREKTLSFLWQIIYKFETPFVKQSATTIQTWFRSLPVVLKRRLLKKKRLRKESAANKIRNWYLRNKLAEKIIFFAKSLKFYMDFMKREQAAIKIQNNFRLYICRKRYVELKQIIVKIQSRGRGWLVRNIKSHNIRSIINIQSYVRMFIQRRRFLKFKLATILIQQRFRAMKALKLDRARYLKLKKSVSYLQEKYRANLITSKDKQAYRELKNATVSLQQRYRGNKLCRIQRERYAKLKSATLIIQQWYRAKITRRSFLLLKQSVKIFEKYYSALRLMRRERYIYQNLRSAALTFQRKYRAISKMRVQLNYYKKLKASTVLIQQKYRAKKQMEVERTQYQNLRSASIFIQRKLRAYLLMKNNWKVYNKTKLAVTEIQNWYRACRKMKECRNYYLALKYAVQIVEQKYEALRLMKRDRNIFELTRSAAITLQGKYRALLSMRDCRKQYIKLRLHCSFVQSIFRANRLSKIQRREYLKLRTSTIVLQQRFRARLEMLRCRQYFQKLKLATILVQTKFRANLLMREQKSSYQHIRRCTINVQRRYRAQKNMLKAKTAFMKLRTATIILQLRWRARKQCLIQRRVFLTKKRNVLFLQQQWRAYRLAKQERNSYEILKKYVIFVQIRWRANRLRNLDFNYYSSLRQSVRLIQQKWRSMKAVKEQKRLYQDLRKAVVCIQKKWRATKLTLRDRNRYCDIKHAVTIIQKRWKAEKMRKEAESYFQNLRNAAITIQQKWRAKKYGEVERKRYQEIRKSVRIIQQKWRAKKIGHYLKCNHLRLKNATVFIQRKWRANKRRDEAIESYTRLKNAAITIQQRWRANKILYEQRCYYQSLIRTVITIQRKWRANKLLQKKRQEYVNMRNSIIQIQSFWRGVRVKKEFLHLREVVISTQQKWRSKRLMITDLKKFRTLKHYTIIVQRRFRANRLMEIQRAFFMDLKKSALLIQKCYRGHIEMLRLRSEYTYIRRIVVKLQTVIRGYLIRQKYEYFLSVEGREQRKIARRCYMAAIKIQAIWKGYKCRKSSIPACEKIYERLKRVNEAVHPEKTLESRATVALRAFTTERPTLFGIIKALEELVYITRHSKEICEKMANILPDQLYVLLCATSRSLPEMNACILSVNILITFCKIPSTRVYSFVPEYMDNLIQVMLHWCDKESVLFPHTCTLLWLFAHNPKWRDSIKSLPNLDQRFYKIRTLVLRKQSMVKKAGVKGSSMFATYKNLPLPNLKPDAGFVSNKTAPNTFSNSVQAMLELSKILEI